MFLNLINDRRSIRKFKDKPVEKEKINTLIEAALRSPSSRSINPLKFIVIDDKILLEKLSKAKPHGAGFLKEAALGILVCGDASKSDVWIEDASIASVFIHLAAHDLGLGSCWIQIRKRDYNDSKTAETYIKELLNLTQDTILVESIIAIGYPDETKKGHAKDSLQFHKVSFNT
ncbi:nitroreductase family protein [Desulfobacula toluolica]|uniref:Predicted NADH dehydrogenase/NAD(P)H nitroreductase n=1 Tax=Desulfobacula toluolica (strain DSM 7467 / Tol2) TaxID=651182 RepID=K0NJZ0_DESTT|nr:nitroreductase family protein [Desulfobacula toluolica]CCK81165.1 predicted NADH dehydrogenase/NAD(P)H nitroreductase [Desulfobacula toluolica Tol2]